MSPFSIPVIFEDENFLIINKPSGLVIHPFDNSIEKTLVDYLKESHPSIFSITENTFTLQNGETIHLGGVVHKLDRETSGVMVIAKNESTFNELKKAFLEHTTKKVYLALVEGTIEADSLRINAPLGRNKKSYKQVAFPANPRGELREAVTDLSVILRGNNLILLKLEPLTGRTHQLRAHMNHIHHPIVGDKAYGSTTESHRIMLHAQTLTFILDNKQYSFEAPAPKEFIEPFG
jgi:23S rRNA pseudouridine1911/1915/1917 synthase